MVYNNVLGGCYTCIMFKCVLCGYKIDTECAVVYGLNPETFRMARFHLWCAIGAYEDLHEDRKQEYLDKIQEIPEVI